MSTQITIAFVQEFKDGITHLQEQKDSRIRGGVRVEPLDSGDRAFFDQIGNAVAYKRTTRHADTEYNDTPHSRRMVVPVPFDVADLIDAPDKIRILNDPTNAYSVAFGRACQRAQDDELIAAFFATARTGVDGSTSTSFDSTHFQIAVAAAGMTLDKILQANQKLRAAENDPMDGFYAAASQVQYKDMLGDTTFTSADYNTVKALMAGEINSFMGFTWIQSERLGVDASSYRRCPFWAKNSMLLGVSKEPMGAIDVLPTKRYSTQIFYSMDIGATRMDEKGVVECLCAES